MKPLPFSAAYMLDIHYSVLYLLIILSSLWCFHKRNKFEVSSTESNFSLALSLLFVLLLSIYWGLRGHSGLGDTGYYVYSYLHLFEEYIFPSLNNEWLWNNFSYFCVEMSVSTTNYLLIIEFLYIGLMFVCTLKLMRNNIWFGMLFFIASFSFLGYGINGIRNGLACSLLLTAISFIVENRKLYKIIGVILMILSTGIHASVIIPVICCLASFVVKDVKIAIIIWGAAVIISLILGNYISNLFADFAFDERASQYLVDAEESDIADIFSDTGFRWDFLLYSIVPIAFAYYLKRVRNFEDRTYDIIAVTYILANAFWILVIRASYSNRFAYLSWFMYPLVLSYPLLRFKIWNNQWPIIGAILFLYYSFTYFIS